MLKGGNIPDVAVMHMVVERQLGSAVHDKAKIDLREIFMIPVVAELHHLVLLRVG